MEVDEKKLKFLGKVLIRMIILVATLSASHFWKLYYSDVVMVVWISSMFIICYVVINCQEREDDIIPMILLCDMAAVIGISVCLKYYLYLLMLASGVVSALSWAIVATSFHIGRRMRTVICAIGTLLLTAFQIGMERMSEYPHYEFPLYFLFGGVIGVVMVIACDDLHANGQIPPSRPQYTRV